VEETLIKLIGDGFLKERSANAETDRTIGNVLIVITATRKEINVSVGTVKIIGIAHVEDTMQKELLVNAVRSLE
jgi:hypothetical protein